jgi:uncharacterized protein YjlB
MGLDNKNDYFQILLNTLATGLKSNKFHKYCVPTCFERNIADLVQIPCIVYEQPQPLNQRIKDTQTRAHLDISTWLNTWSNHIFDLTMSKSS